MAERAQQVNAAQFAHTIAVIESNDNPNAPLGDAGRALGRYQVHPDWVWTQCRRLVTAPILNETWDSFIVRLVEGFYQLYSPAMPDVEVAMFFHLGHHAHPTDGDWDTHYAARFNAAASIS